MTSALKDKG